MEMAGAFFPDGLIESRTEAPDSAGNYKLVEYFSSGKIKQVIYFQGNGSFIQDSVMGKSALIFRKIEEMKKAANKKSAKRIAAAVVMLDSTNVDVYGRLGLLMYERKYFSDAVAAFDKALEIAPFSIYLLTYRAIAGINMYPLKRKWVKPANSETLVLTPSNIKNVPVALREKVCNDLERAVTLQTIYTSFDFLRYENAKKYCEIDLRRSDS